MTADSLTQERVFAFLTDPATHPFVHRIDTHAASVFLEGDRALDQARRPVFLSGLLDPGAAESRLRRRGKDKPPVRAANLPPRRRDHTK
jgi:aminoglycoside phosphotransferase family enzyme